MVATRLPAPSRFAIPIAAKTFAPALDPASTPSIAANFFTMSKASRSVTAMISSASDPSNVFGHETGADALHFVIALLSTAQHRTLGLHRDCESLWVTFFQVARHAGKGPAGSAADYDGIHLSAKLLVEFAAGGLVVEVGIIVIFKLTGDERIRACAKRALSRNRLLPACRRTLGVRITSAPSASIKVTFSCEKPSGTASTVL